MYESAEHWSRDAVIQEAEEAMLEVEVARKAKEAMEAKEVMEAMEAKEAVMEVVTEAVVVADISDNTSLQCRAIFLSASLANNRWIQPPRNRAMARELIVQFPIKNFRKRKKCP
jgi:hypothetical protein